MDLRHLRTLPTIAELGRFGAAARAIGLSQSAVSLHIGALEGGLGTVLFDRRHRPRLLNPAGRALVARAREILDLCAEIEASIRGGEPAAELELGAVPTVLASFPPSALSDFQLAHPEVRIRVVSGLSAEPATLVRRGVLDLTVVTVPPLPRDGLLWQELLWEHFVVVAPAGLPGEVDRELLEARPFIPFSRRTRAGEMIDRGPRERGIAVRIGRHRDSSSPFQFDLQDYSFVPKNSRAYPRIPAGRGTAASRRDRTEDADERVVPRAADDPRDGTAAGGAVSRRSTEGLSCLTSPR